MHRGLEWLKSVHAAGQFTWINWKARIQNGKQPDGAFLNYCTHYFYYYTDYFSRLTRIAAAVSMSFAPQIYVLCFHSERERKLLQVTVEGLKLLNAIHSMRQGAGRDKPEGRKHWQLPLSLVASFKLGRGQAWTVIADTARRLGHRVQIPWTPSPCHLPG
jgi:hypothetical protein